MENNNQADLDVNCLDIDTDQFTEEELAEYNRAFTGNRKKLKAVLSNILKPHEQEDVVHYAYMLGLHRNIPSKCHTNMLNTVISCVKTIGIKYSTENYKGGVSQYCSIDRKTDDGEVSLLDIQGQAEGNEVSIASSQWIDSSPVKSPEDEAIEIENEREMKDMVNRAFNRLTESRQEVILRTVHLEESAAKLADERGITAAGVRSQKRDALKQLRGEIESMRS